MWIYIFLPQASLYINASAARLFIPYDILVFEFLLFTLKNNCLYLFFPHYEPALFQ